MGLCTQERQATGKTYKPYLTLLPLLDGNKKECHLDFETQSEADIRKVGAKLYAEHPSTRLLCICFAVGDGAVNTVTAEGLNSGDVRLDALYALAMDPNCIFVAHNAFFEQCVYEEILAKQFGFPCIPLSRWKCTMAKSYAHGLPGDLDRAGAAMKLTVQKDKDGHTVMMRLCKPRKLTQKNQERWWTPQNDPESFAQLYAYCVRDVETERALDKSLRDLSPLEQRIWEIDQRINHEGIQLDTPMVRRAVEYADQAKRDLLARFQVLTNGTLTSPKQSTALRMWLHDNDVEVANTRKHTVSQLLRDADLSPTVREALQLATEIKKTSLAKYTAMLRRSNALGILREVYQYYGAHTGRWAGRGVQLQNLPRKKKQISIYAGVSHLLEQSYNGFAFMYSDVSTTLSVLMRGSFVARTGHTYFAGDYSQIEARVLAYLAGYTAKLELFRRGEDPYCFAASQIYGFAVIKDMVERQVGKVAELALGFGGGIGAMGSMSKSNDVDLMQVYAYMLSTSTLEECQAAAKAYEYYIANFNTEKDVPLSREAAFVADIIKQRYRKANPQIVKYWYATNDAACQAVLTGQPQVLGEVTWFTHGDFLYCKLPSDRMMAYPFPKVHEEEMANGKIKYTLSYMAVDSLTNKWIRHWTYGGSLVENVAQAVARDVMAWAMLRLENVYPVRMHTHDEAVSEVPLGVGSVKEFEAVMLKPIEWLKDCPIKVDVWEGPRYGKAA